MYSNWKRTREHSRFDILLKMCTVVLCAQNQYISLTFVYVCPLNSCYCYLQQAYYESYWENILRFWSMFVFKTWFYPTRVLQKCISQNENTNSCHFPARLGWVSKIILDAHSTTPATSRGANYYQQKRTRFKRFTKLSYFSKIYEDL